SGDGSAMIECRKRSGERGKRRMSLFASAATAVRRGFLFAHEVILRREVLGISAVRFGWLLRPGRRFDGRGLRRLQVVGEGEGEGLKASGRGVAKPRLLFAKLRALAKRP